MALVTAATAANVPMLPNRRFPKGFLRSDDDDDDGEKKSKPKPKLKLPPTMPMALWSNGLGERQYEWLVDCYRMRVDDDCTHGGGKRHGACMLAC